MHNSARTVWECGQLRTVTVEGPQEEARTVRAGDGRLGAGTVSGAATLSELAEKLLELREHLDQVVADLNAPPDDSMRQRHGGVALGGGFRRSANADRRLHCRECGRIGSTDEAGWTLRLYGDDELHACCPDCDKYLSGNGA